MSYFDAIYADHLLPHRARTGYMYLRDRGDAQQKCWPSIKTIAADLHGAIKTDTAAKGRLCLFAEPRRGS